jgi:hypothetical protein
MKELTKQEIIELDNIELILAYTKDVMRLESLHKFIESDKQIIKKNGELLGSELLDRLNRKDKI